MRVFNNLLVMGLVGVVLVAGSARGASAGPQAATAAAARAEDSAIKSRIAADLKTSASLAPRDIDVDVARGVVTLTGKVRNAAEKATAGRVAKVSGVTRVDNQIEIHPNIDRSGVDTAAEKTKSGLTKAVDATVNAAKKTGTAVQKGVGKTEEAVGKVGEKSTDTSITTRIKASFSGETLLQNTAIDVDTKDRVVTLRGTVGSNAAKARAGDIARSTDGATSVVNQLVVRGS